MWSRRRGQGPYIQFIDSSANLDPDWHPEQVEIMDRATNFKVRCTACTICYICLCCVLLHN
jgi:hypothetical protein